MNTTLLAEWIKRLFGWGLPLISGAVTAAVIKQTGDLAMGACVGGAVAAGGAVLVTKGIPYVFPTAAKVAAANQMPAPAPKIPNMPGPGGLGKGGL